jgi:uncharacterized protein
MTPMQFTSIAVLALAILTGCGKPTPPRVSLQDAAKTGNLEAIQHHIKAGSNLNEREPVGGSSPLHTAAAFGQVEAVRALIKAGADVNSRNKEGSTPLHTAAFLCRPEIVQALLEKGADKNARNNAGATALESVAGPFADVKGIYDYLQSVLGPLGLKLDYEHIKATRPKIADMLR